MVALTDPLVTALGDRSAAALDKALGLRTVGDLLHHYPHRYAERGRLTPLDSLEVGDFVTIVGRVERSSTRTSRNGKKLAEVVVTDGRGELTLTFFGYSAPHHAGKLRAGTSGLFSGKLTRFGNGPSRVWQLTHPDYEVGEGFDVSGFTGELLPVYPAAAAFSSWNIAKAVRLVLDVVDAGDDPLPPAILAAHDLLPLGEALRLVHRPPSKEHLEQARARLKWDEALVLQTVLMQRRHAAQRQAGVPRHGRDGGLLDAFDAASPFSLTAGQQEVGEALTRELASPRPMHRLLQGEVGSGKTLVALRAMLRVVDSGGQAALLAPTEVLAQQHARSLRALLGPLAQAGELGGAEQATRVALLTGSLPAAARRRALIEAASGEAGLVVGTHALLSEGVQFADLGLVVVDEQHRFGVEQREALRAKGTAPHVLVMTATPIPRTVAMTVYGDLEVLTLRELPAGRSPIASHVVPLAEHPQWVERAWQRVREAVGEGRRAFVVCPRVGDADDPGQPDADGRRPPVAVEELAPLLQDGPLAGLRVGVLHGRMPTGAKDDAMQRFAAGDLEVLVATTVIEVGVDVPEATVMVVMDAERFGVSQLHQLRGRVGRGRHAGLCLLVTEAPEGSPGRQRLEAVAATTDGFALSRVDLETRREGDVLGTLQSGGRTSLRMLQLLRDEDVIRAAREAAEALVEDDPDLEAHPALAAAVDAVLHPVDTAYLEKT